MNIKCLPTFFPCLLLIAFFSGCDTFQDDSIGADNQVQFRQARYYLLPGGTLLINVNSVVKESWTDATLKITKSPSRGDLGIYDSLTFRYKPDNSFIEGKDEFEVSALNSGKVIGRKAISINVIGNLNNIDCEDDVSIYAIEDLVFTTSDHSVDIKATANDHFCGLDNTQAKLSIYSNPTHGEAKVDGASVSYTPSPGFTGIDHMVYVVSNRDPSASTESALIASYGLITINVSNTLCSSILQDFYILDLTDTAVDPISLQGCEGAYEIIDISDIIAGPCEIQNVVHFTALESSNNHGDFCVDDKFTFTYYVNSQRPTLDDLARYNICVNGQCKIVTFYVLNRPTSKGSWTILPGYLGDVTEYLTMFFVTEQTGFIGGLNKILKTTDGGATWKNTLSKVGLDFSTFIYDIHFLDTSNGYASFTTFDALSSPTGGGLLKTSNGGDTWEEKPFTEGITDIHFISLSVGFVAKRNLGPEKPGIYKTINGGTSWELVYRGLDSEEQFQEIKDISFLNSTTGYATLRDKNSYVLKTTNAGESWSPSSSTDFMNSLSHNGQILFAATGNEGTDWTAALSRSVDGETWSRVVDQEKVLVSYLSFSPHGTLGMEVGMSQRGGRLGPLALITHNSGLTWQTEVFNLDDYNKLPIFYNVSFGTVSVPSERMAYVLASDNTIGTFLMKYTVK